MKKPALITFLSDFGTRDGYVGAVKGIMKSIAPNSEIIDISHDIDSFNIGMAAFSLLNYYKQYPAGTIHLVVIDPGVGSERDILILKTKDHLFVGPDNGIFHYLQHFEKHDMYRVDPAEFYDNSQGSTFHARDIFGPIAARLASGERPENLGRMIEKSKQKFQGKSDADRKNGNFEINCIAHDHFGNIIFDFNKGMFHSAQYGKIKSIRFKNFESNRIYDYYSQVKKGEPLFLWNSLGFLELAVNEGNAADMFHLNPDKDRVKLVFESQINEPINYIL